MSDDAVLDVRPRRELYHGIHDFGNSWVLKLFSVSVSQEPFQQVDTACAAIEGMLGGITSRLSAEFEYGRFGFALVHAGNRGTCVTVTHFGRWGPTFEVFSSVWYRYGHGFDHFDLLDDIEPAVCWFEVPRACQEIQLACALAQHGSLSYVRTEYLGRPMGGATW